MGLCCTKHMDRILLFGTNLRRAPVVWRERVALSRVKLPTALRALCTRLPEVAILSTCNRLEIYAVAENLAADGWMQNDYLAVARSLFGLLPREDSTATRSNISA